ncbi:hypothetical protein [Helicobacter zhangjianzhongii]|uniref:hypothetical protein n=1 Tax=Helicobacter zhangjianzhongii TaxID=2974574 RepID=UPI00255624EF|nr:hypothetical protein [Helicobacter sp. CPD2-1]MDL0079436.1 hypothetical protein [Helicobacter sp. CPD2-1]
MRWQNENPSNDNTKVAKISKVDSSNKAFLSSLRALRSKAWQSIQTKTQALESTFLYNAEKTQKIQKLQKVDSRIFYTNAIFATAKNMDSKETSANAERYPLFSKEATLCHATATQCLAMTEKSTASKKVDSRICDEKTSEAVQGAAEAGFFSKAESSSKKPTPPTNQAAGGRIFSEKAGLCSLLCGDKPSGLSHKQKANSPLFRKKPTPPTSKTTAIYFALYLLAAFAPLHAAPESKEPKRTILQNNPTHTTTPISTPAPKPANPPANPATTLIDTPPPISDNALGKFGAQDSSFFYKPSPSAWVFGDILHPYIGFGLTSSSSIHTHNTQSMSKEVATCPNQKCSGDTTSAEYSGQLNAGSSLELGAEYFFNKFHIVGIRLFGEVASRSGSLGSKIAGSDKRDRSTNNLQEAYNLCIQNSKTWSEAEKQQKCGILILGNSTNPNTPNTKVEDSFTFQDTPDSNDIAPQDGRYLSFSLGVDAMLNIPIDTILQRWLGFGLKSGFWGSRLAYFKVGGFIGGGAEFARFSQGDPNNKTWHNQAAAKGKASNGADAFFAAGSGGFMRFGASIYLSRFTRIDFGYKISYYPIAQERWYGYNGAHFDHTKYDPNNGLYGVGGVREDDPWSESLLRQKFVSTKDKEWFLRFALSF